MKLYKELVKKYIPESRTDCLELDCRKDCGLFDSKCQMKIEKVE